MYSRVFGSDSPAFLADGIFEGSTTITYGWACTPSSSMALPFWSKLLTAPSNSLSCCDGSMLPMMSPYCLPIGLLSSVRSILANLLLVIGPKLR